MGRSPETEEGAVASHRRFRLTLVLIGGCLVVSLPLLLVPSLRGTIGTRASQPLVALLTSPFVHGFSTTSLLPHLIGNLVLLWHAGSRVETALGTLRFALLTFAALGAYAVIRMIITVELSGTVEVNGASVFIWAYAPPLAVLYRSRSPQRGFDSRRTLPERGPDGGDTFATPMVLAVMWLIVPVLMTTVPYSFGWSGGLVGAFLMANTFHIGATVVGIGGAWILRKQL